jgi:hypothetical protein
MKLVPYMKLLEISRDYHSVSATGEEDIYAMRFGLMRKQAHRRQYIGISLEGARDPHRDDFTSGILANTSHLDLLRNMLNVM